MAREIQLTDWSTAENLSNRSSGVQIPRDICTRFGRYLYSTKCSWIINSNIRGDCSVRRIVTSLTPSLLFRCFSLFLPHLRTLAQEKKSQNCLRFGNGGQSLCLYQLLSQNIIFSPSLTTAARAKKKVLANRSAHAISEHYRDLVKIY